MGWLDPYSGANDAEHDGFWAGMLQALVLIALSLLFMKWGWGLLGEVFGSVQEGTNEASRLSGRTQRNGLGYAMLFGLALELVGLLGVACGIWWIVHIVKKARSS